MSYVYIITDHDPKLWTVGFYDPKGQFIAATDHGSEEEAAHRVHFLNGGGGELQLGRIVNALQEIDKTLHLLHEQIRRLQ